jgi:hypothetical protein
VLASLVKPLPQHLLASLVKPLPKHLCNLISPR